MGQIAYVASGIKDFMNGRYVIDLEMFQVRAEAAMSQLLQSAIMENPKLMINPKSQAVIKEHPFGLDSLPAKVRYESFPIGQILNARWN